MSGVTFNMSLSAAQQATAKSIVDYGNQHGYSATDIAIALKTAYFESRLGVNTGTPQPSPDNPNPTASGLYQYTDATWNTYHANNGDKSSIDNQIHAFFEDISTYKNWYNNSATNGNIPLNEINFGEYVYIKHHDGRGFDNFLNAPGLTIWNNSSFILDPLSAILDFIFTPAYGADINPLVNAQFNDASYFPQRSDPFTLDLDGDGLETVGVNTANPLLFDLNATGIKQSVGWVKPDDGFLALDRDGNGTIDSGAELFGDSTPLSNGGTAIDGFAAIADLDSNGDGVVNAQDARFAELRVWQGLNQDALSQDGELKTLGELGIVAINVAKTENSRLLPNGNQLADLGTFVRADGSTGSAGVASRMADVNLVADTFNNSYGVKYRLCSKWCGNSGRLDVP